MSGSQGAFAFNAEGPSLASARAELLQQISTPKGTICPCCGKHAKIYGTAFNDRMLRALCELDRLDRRQPGKYFHYRSFYWANKDTTGGDYSKMKYWGLIDILSKKEAREVDPTIKRTTGYWRINQRGRDFLDGKIQIPRVVWIYRAKVVRYSEDMTTPELAAQKKFNWQETRTNTV